MAENMIAKKIKQFRTKREMTQQALATKAGISLGYLARLEIGMHEPKVVTLRKVARALAVPLAELLD